MNENTTTLLKVLINRFHSDSGASFLQKFPKNEAQEILRCNVISDTPTYFLNWENDLITIIHYSWLVPLIEQLNPDLQGAVIASLPEPQSSKLKAALKVKSIPEGLSKPVKEFLLHQMLKKWDLPSNFIPFHYLPKSSLSPLLGCSKSEIVDLIDMLAMQDLAEALRHIVDKNNLKWIYQNLPKKHQQFLRVCLHQKEKISAPKLEIDKCKGDPKKLESILHLRGILRIGKALCGQDPLFAWYLTHILDTGRGAAIAKYYQEQAIPNITSHLVQQLLLAINFLKKKSTP